MYTPNYTEYESVFPIGSHQQQQYQTSEHLLPYQQMQQASYASYKFKCEKRSSYASFSHSDMYYINSQQKKLRQQHQSYECDTSSCGAVAEPWVTNNCLSSIDFKNKCKKLF